MYAAIYIQIERGGLKMYFLSLDIYNPGHLIHDGGNVASSHKIYCLSFLIIKLQ